MTWRLNYFPAVAYLCRYFSIPQRISLDFFLIIPDPFWGPLSAPTPFSLKLTFIFLRISNQVYQTLALTIHTNSSNVSLHVFQNVKEIPKVYLAHGSVSSNDQGQTSE